MTRFGVISADSHVLEQADLWLTHIDPKFRDRAPRIVRQDGVDRFFCDGAPLAGVTMLGGAGQDPTVLPRHGTLDQARRGGWDPHERLKDMQMDGVDAEVLYPSVGLVIYRIQEAPFLHACLAAYNTWLAEFCSAYPDRLKGIAMVSLDDLAWATQELRRARKLGLAGVMAPVHSEDGAHTDRRYDAFWAVAEELDAPVSLHLATGRRTGMGHIANMVMEAGAVQRPLAEMVFSGLFDRFPKLKVISVENDCGWAGHFIERMDKCYVFHHVQFEFPIRRPPSEYFHEHVFLTFMRDLTGIRIRDRIGVGNLMWSSDYPHHDSTWPHSQEVLAQHFAGVPEAERRQIVAGNAERLYHFG